MKLPVKTSTGIHPLSPHVTLEWLDTGRMVVLTLKDNSRTAVADWAAIIQAVATDWDTNKPYLALYDLSGIEITPYYRERGLDISDAVQHLSGRYAVVLDDGGSMSTMRLYFKMAIEKRSAREGKIFTDRDKALAWLREKL